MSTNHFKNPWKVRQLTRLIAFGGHTQSTYEDNVENIHPGKSTSISESINRMEYILSEQTIRSIKEGNRVYYSFSGDGYLSSKREVARLYTSISLLPRTCFYYIFALKYLSIAMRKRKFARTSELTGEDVWGRFQLHWETRLSALEPENTSNTSKKTKKKDKLYSQAAREWFRNLKAAGIVSMLKKGKYILPNNPLKGLTEQQVSYLMAGIAFYQNLALLSLPGYYLNNTLGLLYREYRENKVPDIYQFKGTSPLPLMEEQVVAIALEALKTGQGIGFKLFSETDEKTETAPEHCLPSKEGDPKGYPIKAIITDTVHHRQYFQIVGENGNDPRRVDGISEVILREEGKPIHKRKWRNQKNKQKPDGSIVELRIFAQDALHKERILQRLSSRGDVTILQQGDDHTAHVQVHFPAPNAMRFLPFLRTLFPAVEILDAHMGKELYKRTMADLKEVARYYE